MDYGTLFYLVLDNYSSVRIIIETEESLETEEICVTPYAYVSLELYLAQLSSKVSCHTILCCSRYDANMCLTSIIKVHMVLDIIFAFPLSDQSRQERIKTWCYVTFLLS